MKDFLSLLVVGALFALLGWALWHYLGPDALCTLVILTLVAVTVDNARLRRQLRKRDSE